MIQNSGTYIDLCRKVLDDTVSATDRLLVAVSGGADSIGLLGILRHELGVTPERLVVGHVDHKLRPTSRLDRECAENASLLARVRFVHAEVDAAEVARKNKVSLEVAGRKCRYNELLRMSVEHGCQWILTAHTQDDSAETVLMKMRSGAPWYEWTGIPVRRGKILRPLLRVPRREVRKWVDAFGMTYRDDESNSDCRFLRNRLRLAVSRRRDFWTAHRVSDLADSGESLRIALEAQCEMARLLVLSSNLKSGKQSIRLAIDEILMYFSDLAFLPVEMAWNRLCPAGPERLASAFRRQVASLVRGTSPQAEITLPDGVHCVRRGRKLWVQRPHFNHVHQILAPSAATTVTETGRLEFSSQMPGDVYASSVSHRVLGSLRDRRLVLRNWQAGDRMKPVARPTKRVTDLMTELHFDLHERQNALVLADDNGPLVLLGGPIAERALPTMNDNYPLWITWQPNT